MGEHFLASQGQKTVLASPTYKAILVKGVREAVNYAGIPILKIITDMELN